VIIPAPSTPHNSINFVNCLADFTGPKGQASIHPETLSCTCYRTVATPSDDFVFPAIVLLGAAALVAYARWDYRRSLRRNANDRRGPT
jgi:hypothetical protein